MDFREAISGELPAPRDDEPAGLRQDILDELADHLARSFNRELLRGAQPEEARRRAIERFGSPAAVARRLWLDAMKGKIMAQRFWIATSLIVMAACVGLTGLAWSQSKRIAAEQAEANRRLAEAIDQTRTANEAILRRLEDVAKRSSKSSVWVPIKLRLTLEKPDGPPAVGYDVFLSRGWREESGNGGYGNRPRGGVDPTGMHRKTNDSGLADFGVVQPGDWVIQVGARPWTLRQRVNVLPDTPIDQTIACPIRGKAPVKVRVDWPKSLVDKDLVVVAEFQHQGVKVGTFAWDSTFQGSMRLLCRARHGEKNIEAPKLQAFAKDRVLGFLPADSLKPGNEPLDMPAGHFELSGLMLFRPIPGAQRMRIGGRLVGIVTLLGWMDRSGSQQTLEKLHSPMLLGMDGMGLVGSTTIRADRFPPEYLGKIDRFDARPGQPNEWVIPIPDEMARTAGERAEKFVRLFEERVRSSTQPAPVAPEAR